MLINILQIVLILVVVGLLSVPVGRYLAAIFTGGRHFLPERLTYRLFGIDPDEQMTWKHYALALVLSNGVMILLGYAILRLQGVLPLNPQGFAGVDPDLAFNTAVSFLTNTNWQSYYGETTLSNFSQTVFIQFGMFVGPATALAAAGALIRAFARNGYEGLGNFWVDMTRVIYRFFLPLSFALAILFVFEGEPQTFAPNATATTIEGESQEIARGPVASLSSIKHVGTNGGGFFGMNSAHPFENPTNLVNATQIVGMFLLSAATVYAFGTMVARRRQGWVLFATYMTLFLLALAVILPAEQYGNPLLTEAGADQGLTADQGGGNMEGKEVRFGVTQSALFATVTTALETGSVNSMHASMTPLGGLVAMINMQLGNVFGGVGVGFMYLIQYAIVAVFIVGLMVGRSPEFLGKKIEAREISLVVLSILITPLCILGFTGLALVWPGALDSLANPGAHGYMEILYAYSSATANNGSAFAGLSADTPFFNTTLGLAILFGRYLTILPLLAVAGSLAAKRPVPETAGTFSTATPLFAGVLAATILLIGGLTYFPSWALGGIVEHLQMLAGQTF